MAGEIWRTYDVAAIGNDGFDNDDLNHLLKQRTSNNDILKIAAASGRVDATVDERLRRLNTESTKMNKISLKAQRGLLRRGIMDNAVYLGGDPDDDKNYAAGSSGRKTRIQNSPNVGGSRYEDTEDEYPTQWRDNASTRDIPRGDRSEVLTWQGINADGTAAALRGTRIEPDRDGDKRLLKTRNVTWRTPDDYLAARAPKSSNSSSQTESAAPEETSAAPPLSERFDASRYALRTPVSPRTDVTEEARRQARFGFTNTSGGIELGGYERFLKGLPSGLV